MALGNYIESSQDVAAGFPHSELFHSDLTLEVMEYLFCHVPFIRNKLPSVIHIQGEGITVCLFKGGVSKSHGLTRNHHIWQDVGLLSGKFYKTLCERVQAQLIGQAN